MLAQPLIDILEKLLKLHKSLNQLALEKTEVLKKGSIEALNSLIKNEQTHISAIQKMEKERMKFLAQLFPDKVDQTLADILKELEQPDCEKIQSVQQKLMIELDQLRSANNLNQQLLEQSLQFVSLSLDLLLPTETPNYSNGNEEEAPYNPQYSLFDSKA